MKVCNVDRTVFYKIVKAYFNALGRDPVACEIGVLKGDNAEQILNIIKPKKLYLIDEWKCEDKHLEKHNEYHKAYLSWELNEKSVKKIQRYYGGDLNSQSTYDKLYTLVENKFKDCEHVTILRKSSIDAFKELEKREKSDFDFCYIDADHYYESVLDDLLFFSRKLSEIGLIQINDCCHSDSGVEQNFGVLEAAVKFCKLQNFEPSLITNTDWSDAILIPQRSKQVNLIDNIVKNSNISFVEVPNALMGAARVIGKTKANNFKGNISFN